MMKYTKILISRTGALLAVFGLLTAVVVPVILPAGQASAAQITTRKIQVGSSELGSVSTDANGVAVPAGQGGNGAQTYHTFTFTPTASTIGSIVFEYCDSPFIGTTCTMPGGMDAGTVNAITSPTGISGGAFALDTTTNAQTTGWFATGSNACNTTLTRNNCILIKRTAAAETSTAKSFTFGASGGWLKNPTATTPNSGTFYVRIVTFSDNTFTTPVDNGTVAFDVNNDIDITAKVQEQLKFSISSSTNVATASCVALPAGTSLTLGSSGVLDASNAYDTHSYFRVSTNSANGTAVQYTGDTLRTPSGGFTITAPAGPTASTVGSEQFGLGFDSADPIGVNGWSVTHLTTRTAAYNVANGTIVNAGTAQFAFSTASTTAPVTLASSSGIVGCDTLSVRYLANIAPTTEPGIYKTNIGYIATPTY